MSYRTVSLPSPLVEEIKSHMESLGYSSIAEFVKDTVRRFLEELNSRGRPSKDGIQEVPTHAV